mgnify:FL=1|tara:strand:- start:329 stop:622 length:294 start_codon:yes stop_codon:yes gene_type:complete
MIKGLTLGLLMVISLGTNDKIWTKDMTDQQKCQAEADFMIKYHKNVHVGPCIGKFEGMGYSVNGRIPNTCTPRRKMKLTGDATARDGNRVARVRSWR